MKYSLFLFAVVLIFTFACKETIYNTDIYTLNTRLLEGEIDSLKDDIGNLQSVISLQHAYIVQKKIVSITKNNTESVDYWLITFADNTTLQLLGAIVKSWDLNKVTNEYIIELRDNRLFVFNKKEIIYPSGIVVLTQEVKIMKNSEISIEFRVNPSNAVFNYDVSSKACQIALDLINIIPTYSYVSNPERCRLTRIEQTKNPDNTVREGQYRAFITDNGRNSIYKYNIALVLSSADKNGDRVQLSSSPLSVERKKDTGLPVVTIYTDQKAEIRDKENWTGAQMKIDGITKFPDYEGRISIRGRGNSTWAYPKKPFAIKLNNRSEILGMPSHRSWILLANYMDRTLLRNHIAFEISRRTGLEWTVRGQFVEVVLNDLHIGNYYLCEHINADVNRVNITEMDPYDITGETITGGYILEYDRYFDDENKFRSKLWNFPVNIKEPGEDNLQPEQFDYIRNYIDSLEQLLTEPDFAQTGKYSSMIADTTFIDWWIVMELTGNNESHHPGSCYFYKDRSDVLKAGPMWDFDWGTFRRISEFRAKDQMYYSQLFKDPVFVSKVKERWNKFKPFLNEIPDVIAREGKALTVSAELNDALWSLSGDRNINEDEKLTYSEAISRMSSNYVFRLNWLDAQIRNLR